MRELTKSQVDALREQYPAGSRIRLIRMSDPYHPVPPGTKGTLVAIDDLGTFHVRWDNGRGLGLVPGRVQRLPALLGQEITDGRYFDDPAAADMRNFKAFEPFFEN